MKKIAVITGTRAEYGYLKPLMQEIQKDKQLQLIPIITGMHLIPQFGNTYKTVEKDFPQAVKIPMKYKGDTLKDMAIYLSSGVQNLSEYFNKNLPDIMIILGDRTEHLAAALAGMYLNIPIVHINGGDVSGGIDESIRHSITKIAHIHFTHTEENAKRIEKMGENKERIHIVGALTLDTIKNKKLPSKKEIFNKYKLDEKQKTFLAVQHPVTTLPDQGYTQMKELFQVLDKLQEQTVMIFPNCDAGGQRLIDLIKQNEDKKYLHIIENMPHEDYLSIMKSSNLMIGNSSSGIIEASSFKTPVINIGNRQQGRERSTNIIDAKPESQQIIKAVNHALNDKNFTMKLQKCENKFGDGKTAKRIVKILKNIKIDKNLIQKQITY